MRFAIIGLAIAVAMAAVLSLALPLMFPGARQAARALAVGRTVPARVEPGDMARGEKLYRSRCYGCHAPEARYGPPHNTPEFKAKYPDDALLAEAIQSGRHPMPAFSATLLDQQQLADLVVYIRSLK